MKVAIVTWITYKNYGTMLQAYALQQQLLKMGFDNVIVSDECIILGDDHLTYNKSAIASKEMSNCVSKTSLTDRVKKYILHPIKFIRNLMNLLNDKIQYKKNMIYYPYVNSQKYFDSFKQHELNISRPYKTNELSTLNNEFDVFVCGSDQIWSVFDVNFNGYYYLDFVTKKKISYAPSLGTLNISENKMSQIKAWTMDFSGLSVREYQSSLQLERALERKVTCVCDPTLLLDKQTWQTFAEGMNVPRKKYILCYFLDNNPWYFAYLKSVSKYLGLKIVLIPSKYKYCENKNVYKEPVGPKEFVALIANSEFVVTDSYHGSIFSIIFEKTFLYLSRFKDEDPLSQNIRIDSLFNKLGLTDCIIKQKRFSHGDIKRIDYARVNDVLNEFRTESKEFLKTSLTEI